MKAAGCATACSANAPNWLDGSADAAVTTVLLPCGLMIVAAMGYTAHLTLHVPIQRPTSFRNPNKKPWLVNEEALYAAETGAELGHDCRVVLTNPPLKHSA